MSRPRRSATPRSTLVLRPRRSATPHSTLASRPRRSATPQSSWLFVLHSTSSSMTSACVVGVCRPRHHPLRPAHRRRCTPPSPSPPSPITDERADERAATERQHLLEIEGNGDPWSCKKRRGRRPRAAPIAVHQPIQPSVAEPPAAVALAAAAAAAALAAVAGGGDGDGRSGGGGCGDGGEGEGEGGDADRLCPGAR